MKKEITALKAKFEELKAEADNMIAEGEAALKSELAKIFHHGKKVTLVVGKDAEGNDKTADHTVVGIVGDYVQLQGKSGAVKSVSVDTIVNKAV